MSESEMFYKAFRGNFSSLLRWQQLDEFWNVVRRNPVAGLVMSLIPPQPIESRRPLPATRQRWWLTLWA
jgi:hypothetical protein